MIGTSPVASNLLSIAYNCAATEEERNNFLVILVKDTVANFIASRLEPLQMIIDCPTCNTHNPFTRETKITSSSSIVILQLERFTYIVVLLSLIVLLTLLFQFCLPHWMTQWLQYSMIHTPSRFNKPLRISRERSLYCRRS